MSQVDREPGQAQAGAVDVPPSPAWLRSALEAEIEDFKRNRAIIEQAKGVLMQLLAVDPDQAFAALSRYSQTHNVKLRTLAERLTAWASEGVDPPRHLTGRQVSELLERLARTGADEGDVVGSSAAGPVAP